MSFSLEVGNAMVDLWRMEQVRLFKLKQIYKLLKLQVKKAVHGRVPLPMTELDLVHKKVFSMAGI